jgi:hypothetical protein
MMITIKKDKTQWELRTHCFFTIYPIPWCVREIQVDTHTRFLHGPWPLPTSFEARPVHPLSLHLEHFLHSLASVPSDWDLDFLGYTRMDFLYILAASRIPREVFRSRIFWVSGCDIPRIQHTT